MYDLENWFKCVIQITDLITWFKYIIQMFYFNLWFNQNKTATSISIMENKDKRYLRDMKKNKAINICFLEYNALVPVLFLIMRPPLR